MALRELILRFQKKHTGLRKAAREVDVSHVRLIRLRDSVQIQNALDVVEEIRVDLGLSEAEAYRVIVAPVPKQRK